MKEPAHEPRVTLQPSQADLARKVRDGMVTVDSQAYVHPIFLELEGREVGLRPITDDKRELHVFVDGRWAGDAYLGTVANASIERRHAIRYEEQPHRSLQGARLVETENFATCDRVVRKGATDLEMVACYGEAGLGKTLATCRATARHAERLGLRLIRIAPEKSLSGGGLVGMLLEQLFDVHVVKPTTGRAHMALLFDQLQTPTLIHIDEAQYLSAQAMHIVRHIDDLAHIPVCFVLSGGNTFWKVLSSDPMLKDRVPHRAPFRRFREDEIPDAVRAFHPMFDRATDEQLLRLDQIYAHGVFRDWRHIARSFQSEGWDPSDDEDHDKVLIDLGVRGRGV
jgi:hypothetical protein